MSMFNYWGKTRQDQEGSDLAEDSYHLLVYHSLDVAAVCWFLLDPKEHLCRRLAKQLEVKPIWLQQFFVFCLALHDLGKFARSFQGLKNHLSEDLVKPNTRMLYSQRHDSLGFRLWQKNLAERLGKKCPNNREWLTHIIPWMEIVCGHHGMPPQKSGERIQNYFEKEDEDAACQFAEVVLQLFLADFDTTPLFDQDMKKKLRIVSWQLAGVTVLSDWLGSNQDFFGYHSEQTKLVDYWNKIALDSAKQAIQVIPQKPRVRQFRTISDLFSFIKTPTPLQNYALTEPLSDSPQIFILEDVTGAGKTEAALILTHRLLDAGIADGLYVALPTMATANAMYQRLGKVYRHFYVDKDLPSLILAHGARQFSEEFRNSVILTENTKGDANYICNGIADNQDLSATAYCNSWLADNRKKALLSDVGVGTIDQALLCILPARHQSLRLLGLGHKVLLVDEVHAYDSYMQQLLDALIEIHARQGGSVILLSATLPQVMRLRLVSAFNRGLGKEIPKISSKDYPLATHFPTLEKFEQHIDTREVVKRTVKIVRLNSEEDVIAQIALETKQGKCVCWIRNTVKSARTIYNDLTQVQWLDPKHLHLFHSRFVMQDRQRIEADILKRFGDMSDSEKRQGQVLIATQVVEQSLDLDFDVMISDLAPVDLIIQRAGRLCRHIRDEKGNRIREEHARDQRGKATLYLFSPRPEKDVDENWLKTQQPGTQAIYCHIGQLWLTAKLLFGNEDHGQLAMPEDARELIEGVYSCDAEDTIPESLLKVSMDAVGRNMTQRSMADLNALKINKGYTWKSGDWDEEIRIPTRLTDENTVSVALAYYKNEKLVPYAQNVFHEWSMSVVKIPEREWQEAKNNIPANMKPLIEKIKNEVKALRWLEIFPVIDETDHYYNFRYGWNPVTGDK